MTVQFAGLILLELSRQKPIKILGTPFAPTADGAAIRLTNKTSAKIVAIIRFFIVLPPWVNTFFVLQFFMDY
jgi:hypothetical protein